ncbi:hypothetical protein [Acetobacter persici]|uniref:hypothetical protein n=1 Tax=Acetobacter persici TaxID=1076596 RepID=UPI0012FD4BDB|nr:hypothetical protein [Acetobacter persici]
MTAIKLNYAGKSFITTSWTAQEVLPNRCSVIFMTHNEWSGPSHQNRSPTTVVLDVSVDDLYDFLIRNEGRSVIDLAPLQDAASRSNSAHLS